MSHNIRVILVSSVIGLLCMGLQCDKEYIADTYKFAELVELFPAKTRYSVGDTIWLKYSNPDGMLYDKLSNREIKADTLSLDLGVSFNIRYGVPFIPVDGLCDYITSNGVNVGRSLGPGNGTGFSYNFGCNSTNEQSFLIGVVPKIAGIFSLEITDNALVNVCPNRISGYPISSIGYRFNVKDGNKDIYLSIPASQRGESDQGYTERRIDNKQVFIVQVN